MLSNDPPYFSSVMTSSNYAVYLPSDNVPSVIWSARHISCAQHKLCGDSVVASSRFRCDTVITSQPLEPPYVTHAHEAEKQRHREVFYMLQLHG